jgi:hypothetical protein
MRLWSFPKDLSVRIVDEDKRSGRCGLNFAFIQEAGASL